MIGQLLAERYLVVKQLGSGGFSETYLARDKYRPQHPLCVVKCLKLSSNSTISADTAQRLFATEAHILDELGQQHDQIPTLFAYCQQEDLTYQVQEYIDGENLGGWNVRKRRLSAHGAIELLLDLLPVLDYIHSHQVIHRDIKPSNLIQRRSDGKVVLIDFGAAYCQGDAEGAEVYGEIALEIGTPGYMPREQQAGQASYSSDLYALGLSVISLLTGIAPLDLEYDTITGTLDWQYNLWETIDPKLVAVLERMVQEQPRDRFARAADVLSALEGFPAAKKRRGWSVSAWQQSASRLSAQAKQVFKPAIAVSLIALAGGWYFIDRGQAINAGFAQVGALMHRSSLQLTLLQKLPMQSAIDQMLIAPNDRVLVTAGADYVLRLWSLPNGSLLRSLSGHRNRITALSISRDSRFLISGSEDRTVRLWDLATGELLREFAGSREAITSIALSPDEQTIASGSKDGTVRLWNLQDGILLKTLTVPNAEVTAVVFGGTSLISASRDRTSNESGVRQLQVWNLASGRLRRTFAGHTKGIVKLQMVNDQTLLSVGTDQSLLWDLDREKLVRVFAESAQPVTAFLDDQRLLTVYDDGSIQMRTRANDWVGTTIAGRWQNLRAALSPSQRYLACWSPDQQLRIWQIPAVQ